MQGWYQDRGSFQVGVIIGLGTGSLLLGVFFLWFLRNDLKRNILALSGLVVVFGFVLIRAVGFHDMDALIGTRIGSIRMNWILELSGLVLIILNAIILLRRHSKPE